MKRRPLEGVRVLDLSMMWAGPYCTKLLAEMGAEVVKVESPRAWDNIRTLIPQPGAEDPWNTAFYFQEYNREKQSVVLDLALPAGRDALLRLAAHCDVLIENYRADVMDKLDLGYDAVRAVRPDIVYVSMAAFGKTGADRDLVGFGPVIELMSGLASLTGYLDDDEPFKTGISYGDPVAGVHAAGAIALALVQRHRTGSGCFIDLAQRQGAAALAGEAFVRAQRRGGEPPRHLGNRSERWAPQGAYQCEGKQQWVVVSVVTDAQWRACCGVVGRDDLATLTLTERFARHDELDAVLGEWAAGRGPQEAMEAMQAVGVPAGRVLDTATVHDDPHLEDRGFWVNVENPKMHPFKQAGIAWRFAECDNRVTRHAPFFGEHTRAVLTSVAGLTDAEVDQLYAAGVTADAPVNPGVG
ncbi:MAG TPA: CoA transferase [Acidimicrobiales bacterium]|nr:CoA transferase [Acidimicrobiales bacterium]